MNHPRLLMFTRQNEALLILFIVIVIIVGGHSPIAVSSVGFGTVMNLRGDLDWE